jgi:hypothetical protein
MGQWREGIHHYSVRNLMVWAEREMSLLWGAFALGLKGLSSVIQTTILNSIIQFVSFFKFGFRSQMFKQVNHDIQTNINFQPIFCCRISVTNKKKKDEFTHISRKVVRLLPHLVLQESESHKRVNLRLSSINQQI